MKRDVPSWHHNAGSKFGNAVNHWKNGPNSVPFGKLGGLAFTDFWVKLQ